MAGGDSTEDAGGDTTEDEDLDEHSDVADKHGTHADTAVQQREAGHVKEDESTKQKDDATASAIDQSCSINQEKAPSHSDSNMSEANESGVQAALKFADRGWSDGINSASGAGLGTRSESPGSSSSSSVNSGSIPVSPSPAEVLRMCVQSLLSVYNRLYFELMTPL